jgi:hypothetical protein
MRPPRLAFANVLLSTVLLWPVSGFGGQIITGDAPTTYNSLDPEALQNFIDLHRSGTGGSASDQDLISNAGFTHSVKVTRTTNENGNAVHIVDSGSSGADVIPAPPTRSKTVAAASPSTKWPCADGYINVSLPFIPSGAHPTVETCSQTLTIDQNTGVTLTSTYNLYQGSPEIYNSFNIYGLNIQSTTYTWGELQQYTSNGSAWENFFVKTQGQADDIKQQAITEGFTKIWEGQTSGGWQVQVVLNTPPNH